MSETAVFALNSLNISNTFMSLLLITITQTVCWLNYTHNGILDLFYRPVFGGLWRVAATAKERVRDAEICNFTAPRRRHTHSCTHIHQQN